MNKATPISHFSACYELLQRLSRRRLPAVVSTQEDIHLVLALRSAGLIEAETSMPVILRNGERWIERAQVIAITAEGRATLLPRNPKELPPWRV